MQTFTHTIANYRKLRAEKVEGYGWTVVGRKATGDIGFAIVASEGPWKGFTSRAKAQAALRQIKGAADAVIKGETR